MASRRRLLEAAACELVERGGILEVESVAGRAGVSVGLIYRYFDSKAGLVGAVVEDFYDRYDRSVMEPNPVPGADWPKRERERTARAVAFHYQEPLAPVVLSRLHLEPGVAVIEARRLARHIEAAAHNLTLGQERGEISGASSRRRFSSTAEMRSMFTRQFAGRTARITGARAARDRETTARRLPKGGRLR
jgi:AcrR family transcriptional regulator